MDIMEAIDARVSCRAFDDRPVEQDKLDQIAALVDAINEEGLNVQLYGLRDGDGLEPGRLDLAKRMFVGSPACYVAFAAQSDALAGELVGYYGEELALLITQLGLGNCWVAGTYDQKTVVAELDEGEVLWSVMPIGYAMAETPFTQKTTRAMLRSSDKKPDERVRAAMPVSQLPEWFRFAVDCVIKGPSAVNKQPIAFTYEDGAVTALISPHRRDLDFVDLGIAKLHFQLGAAAKGVDGTWEWGDGGAFVIDGE